MPRIGYGDKEWPNLESLCYDASRYKNAQNDVTTLSHIIGAIASRGPITFTEKAEQAHIKWRMAFNAATREWTIYV